MTIASWSLVYRVHNTFREAANYRDYSYSTSYDVESVHDFIASLHYKVKIWHPYVREEIEQMVTIESRGQAKLDLKVMAPTGRLYANQIVENPYIRYQITDSVQSQVVPTLERQSYQ